MQAKTHLQSTVFGVAQILCAIAFIFTSIHTLRAQDLEEIVIDRKALEIVYTGKDKTLKAEAKAAYSEALENLAEGDRLYGLGKVAYKRDAIPYYLKVWDYNPNNAQLNYKLGLCYLLTPENHKSSEYLERAYALDPNVSALIHFNLGRAYHLNSQFETATKYYKEFIRKTDPELLQQFSREVADPALYIQQCQNAAVLTEGSPQRIVVENLGKTVNTRFAEHSPVINADESVLYYTARTDDATGGLQMGEYYEDVYVVHKINGVWQKPQNIGVPINTKEHDATVGISADGQTLILFKGSTGNGDLYISQLKGDKWSNPKPLSNDINTKYHESSASMSADGKMLFFSSDKKTDNLGQHDIYVATLNDKGEWADPVNLGKNINTSEDEIAPFIHPDGRTLYFSSKGHNSIGGYDIFKSVRDAQGNWSIPVNMGITVNSPDDDVFMVISANGKRGYFATENSSGYGSLDLCVLRFLGPEKPLLESTEEILIASLDKSIAGKSRDKGPAIDQVRLTIVKGVVKDALSNEPLEASIEIVDNARGEVISTLSSNAKTGDFLLTLPSGKNYGIAVKREEYLFHSENFDIPEARTYQELEKDITLYNMNPGSKIVLRNIFFNSGKSELLRESDTELDRLYQILRDHPTLKVEISGHTDNVGSQDYNLKLSENRAKAVVDYLTAKGIPSNQLTYKGYAYSQPIAPNNNDENRALNRRVEFKILAK